MLLKEAKAKSEELKKTLIEKMKENGVTKFENDNLNQLSSKSIIFFINRSLHISGYLIDIIILNNLVI